jgi:hypothetical protein
MPTRTTGIHAIKAAIPIGRERTNRNAWTNPRHCAT